MKKMLFLALITSSLLFPAAARAAIELSLEENRVSRGNIGFIDMQRVFKLYPETARAKENFNEVVRQAEEQINLKKAEILRLRLDMPKFRLEAGKIQLKIKAARNTPVPIPTPPPALAPPAVSTAAPAAAAPAGSPTPPPEASSTSTALSSLPGFSDDPLKEEGLPKTPAGAQKMTSTMPLVGAPPSAPQKPAAAPAPRKPEIHLLLASLKMAKKKVADTTARIEALTIILKEHEISAEKSLMDLESRKTELLLGKIHVAIREIAAREGVSIVIDKAGILYGNSAVDLTERVLNRLKGLRP